MILQNLHFFMPVLIYLLTQLVNISLFKHIT